MVVVLSSTFDFGKAYKVRVIVTEEVPVLYFLDPTTASSTVLVPCGLRNYYGQTLLLLYCNISSNA